MNLIRRSFNLRYSYICGLLAFVMYSLSFLIGHEEESANHMLILVKAGLIAVSALLFVVSCRDDASDRLKTSYAVLSLVILIYEIVLAVAVGKTVLYTRDYPAVLNSIVWTFAGLAGVFRFRRNIASCFTGTFKDRQTRIMIISSAVIATIVIILSAEPSGIMFTWDANTLFDFIRTREYDALYDAKLLLFDNHVSMVYMYLLVLLKLFFGNIRIGFFALNALCIVSASFGMTFLFRNLFPGKKLLSYIMADAIFMFSPWVCGMSTFHMYDYYIWCLFPLLIYFCSEKNWVGFFSIGTMISFSRSPGLVVFGTVCLGIVINDLKAGRKLIEIVSDIKYWFFASVALVFYAFFNWGIDKSTQMLDTTFGFDLHHTVHLLKLYTAADFLWIFFALALIGIVYVFFKNHDQVSDHTRSVLGIVILSDILMFVFYSLFITYRLPRYLDSHIAAIYILGITAFFCFGDTMIKYAVMGAVCVIMLIASFRTMDPVSLLLFKSLNVGDHRVIDYEMTDSAALNDSIICNREYYSYEALVNKVLTYVMNDWSGGDEIMFSLGEDTNTWGLSAGRYSYSLDDGKHYFEEFYDKTQSGLANGYSFEYFDSEDMIPFDMHYVFPEETLADAVASGESGLFYYIYMPTINGGRESQIREDYDVQSEEEFIFRGWKMNCIKFRK